MTERSTPLFLFTLVVMTAIGPFAMQVFLPALPIIQADFGVAAGYAQLAVSLSMLSIALSMLAYGPLADRYGRRPVMLGGLALFLVGSTVCALAPDADSLIVGRVVQAAGGASGMVLARAIVRDVYAHEKVASTLAYLTMAMVVAPMVAPAIGGVLTDVFGWRANFSAAGLAGVLVLLLVVARLAETKSAPPSYPGVSGMLLGFGRLLRRRAFCAYALQGAFGFSVFFAFAAAAPYVMVNVMERPPSEYGFWFVSISAVFMIGTFTAARLSHRVGGDRMILIGSLLVVLAPLACILFLSLVSWAPPLLFVPLLLMALGNGFSIPNSQAGALGVDPAAAGTASGLSGFLQMAIAALFAQVAGSLQDGTPYPMLICMLAAALLSLASFLAGPGRAALRGAAAGRHGAVSED